jgi:N-acetylglucosamine-6-phosphate deacetylase
MSIAYSNGKIFTGTKIEQDKALLVKNGKVEGLVGNKEIPAGYMVEDLQGNLLAPALIDLQIYGGNGKMFSQETSIESLKATYEYCLSGGCSYFMITMATNSMDKFFEGIEVVKQYWQQGGKGLLGLHLEGPYLNPVKKGAHAERFIKKPTVEEVELLLEKGKDVVKMMTVAPECCEPSIIALLQQNAVLVSAGHSNATYEEATAAFNRGIPVATHLFNAMSPLQHRAPGMVGAILDHPTAMSSVVCDGIHAHFAAIRIAKQVMKERLFYITDAVAETKVGEYQHLFRGDHYALPDGTLSGSALTMMRCVQNGVQQLGLSLEESLRMAGKYPASLVRGKKMGVFEKGAEAALVIFDEEYTIKKVTAV